jgi:hypothetical protein
MPTHLLCVGSDNHHLRLPFLHAVTKRGCRHCNGHCRCGCGHQSRSLAAGTKAHGLSIPLADCSTMRQLRGLILQLGFEGAGRDSTAAMAIMLASSGPSLVVPDDPPIHVAK